MTFRVIKQRLRALLLRRWRRPALYGLVLRAEHALFGRKLRIETSSQCQLACPLCSTTVPQQDWRRDHRQVIGWGNLGVENFKRLLDGAGRVREIEISNWGEVFLNRELPAILEYAHQRGVTLTASNGVNLNTASDAVLEALVRFGFRQLVVSIDGASDETYKIYRRNGALHRVLAHIDRINHFKALYRSAVPRLTWRFIVFGHNEHEIDLARAMATARGMAFEPLQNLDNSYSPINNLEAVKRKTGIDGSRNVDTLLGDAANAFDYCSQLWDAPQINWDGALLGCCMNNMRAFDNVLEVGLQRALNGEAYRYAKKMVLGLAPARADIPCSVCPLYSGTRDARLCELSPQSPVAYTSAVPPSWGQQ